MNRRAAAAVLALLAAAVPAPAAAAPAPEGGPPPASVRVEEVRSERLRERRRVTGAVRAVRRSRVAAREGGIVLALEAREGAVVKEGDLLARLDAERLRLDAAVAGSEAAEAEALLEERKAAEAKAKRDLEALEALAARDAARPKEREDAGSDARVAAARTAAAAKRAEGLRGRVALLRRRIADTEIRAPFAGTVTGLHAEVGAWVGEGDAVLDLVSTGDLEVRVDAPQASLAPLRALGGAPLRIVVDATGEERDLRAWRIVGDVDPSSRNFPVMAPLGDGAALAPGMSVTAFVPTGAEAEFSTVSRDAILRGPTGPYVYAVAGGGEGKPASAALVPVEVLFSVGDRAAVRARDLAAGASVVVEGNERLFPGAPILPAPREGAAPEGGPR
jgi:RND family efflux transporter MFP subunit